MKDEAGRMIEDAMKEAEEDAKAMYPDGSMHNLYLEKVREGYVDGYMARWSEDMREKRKDVTTDWTDVVELLQEFQDTIDRNRALAAQYSGTLSNFYAEIAQKHEKYKSVVSQMLRWEVEKQNAFAVACGHVRDGHTQAAGVTIEAYVRRMDNP